MNWLTQIAPTIATAIGGPFGGLAYEAVSKVLGVNQDDAKKMLEDGKLSADQIAAVQQAEIALKARAQELGLDFAKLSVEDRKSARDMQVSTKSKLPSILALLVTLGFFGILAGLMLGKVEHGTEIDIMLGSLGTAWSGIISFYFGSSSSSQSKDSMIYNSTPTK
jgi:hypothetical protein